MTKEELVQKSIESSFTFSLATTVALGADGNARAAIETACTNALAAKGEEAPESELMDEVNAQLRSSL